MDSNIENLILKMLYRKLDSTKVTILHWQRTDIESFHGFNSSVTRLSVKYQFQNSEFEEWFFAKIPVLSESFGFSCTVGVLENELVTYELILPEIHRVMQKNIAPQLFYSSLSNYPLILEDLTSKGYRVHPQKYLFDLEPTVQILQQLAQFHAASVRVHQIRGDVYEWLNSKYITNHPNKSSAKQVGKLFMKLVRRVNPEFAAENGEKLNDFKNFIMPTHFSQRMGDENAFNVFNHGDLWTTNIMFKYDDLETIEDIKLVDFQYALWNTPAFDVFFFFMTSVKFDVFEENSDKLYATYVNTLNDSLQKLGVDKVYSVEELIQDIESKYSCWLYSILIRMAVIFSNPDEFNREMVFGGQLLDGEWYKFVADKWVSYFIRRSIESPENGILNKWYKKNQNLLKT